MFANRFIVVLVLIGLGMSSSMAKSGSKFKATPNWKETFNNKTDSVNTQKWSYHRDLRFLAEAPFKGWYKKAVYSDGRYLHLRVNPVDLDYGWYVLPMISTLDKRSFLYGKFEIRAKCPVEQGAWPAIWLAVCDLDSMNYGEIDVLEYAHCFEQKYYQANVHCVTQQEGKELRKTHPQKVETRVDDWHVYTLEWYPDKLVFFLDSEEVHRVNKDECSNWPFDQRYYLIFNVSFAVGWGATCGYDPKALPLEMLVDWVKYYPLRVK